MAEDAVGMRHYHVLRTGFHQRHLCPSSTGPPFHYWVSLFFFFLFVLSQHGYDTSAHNVFHSFRRAFCIFSCPFGGYRYRRRETVRGKALFAPGERGISAFRVPLLPVSEEEEIATSGIRRHDLGDKGMHDYGVLWMDGGCSGSGTGRTEDTGHHIISYRGVWVEDRVLLVISRRLVLHLEGGRMGLGGRRLLRVSVCI